MRRIDLNVDIGEGLPYDEALLEFASSANVCCGGHAGSWEVAEATASRCRARGVRVGAHPGFPDRVSMGRRVPAQEEWEAWSASVRGQIARFRAAIGAEYVKPHGALYNLLAASEAAAASDLAQRFGLDSGAVMALAGTEWARALGQRAILEGFADRRYGPDGRLVARSEPGAVIVDPAEVAAQAVAIAPRVHTLCLHGDTVGCVELARAVVRALDDAGWEVGV